MRCMTVRCFPVCIHVPVGSDSYDELNNFLCRLVDVKHSGQVRKFHNHENTSMIHGAKHLHCTPLEGNPKLGGNGSPRWN